MKQTIIISILTLVASVGLGQTKISKADSMYVDSIRLNFIKPPTHTNNLIWTFSSQHKPENDTLECLFHEYSEDVFLDKWTKGYIVLIDGYIKNKHTAWAIEYAPMALGFFDNTFLYEDKHIVKNKVLQLALYK